MGLDRLIDLIVQFAELFQVFFYVDEFEEACVLRAGKFNRAVGPGPHWIAPLGIEDAISANVKPEPIFMEVQSLHTVDNYAMNISVGMEYQITDIRLHEIEFEGTEATNCLVAASVITMHVQGSKFNAVNTKSIGALKGAINKQIKKRGGKITGLWLRDASNGPASRYWHEGIELDFGDD